MTKSSSNQASARLVPSVWSLCFFSVACFLTLVSFPIGGGSQQVFVTFQKPWAATLFPWLAFACFLLLLVLGGLYMAQKKTTPGMAALLLGLFGYPLALIVSAWGNIFPWELHDSVIGPDGRRYYFMTYTPFQDPAKAIGRLERETFLYRRIEILSRNSGVSTPIIRPTPVRKTNTKDPHRAADYGQLYLSPSGLLLGMRVGNLCALAYDFETRQFYDNQEELDTLSPFVLLGPTTPIHEPDVETTLYILKARQNPNDSMPRRETLVAGLKHPNAEVRRIARQLLAAYPSSKPKTDPSTDAQE